MISFREWVMRNMKVALQDKQRIHDMQTGWSAALEAVLDNKDQPRYFIEEGNEVARSLAIKLSESKPGDLIPLTKEEMDEYKKIESL